MQRHTGSGTGRGLMFTIALHWLNVTATRQLATISHSLACRIDYSSSSVYTKHILDLDGTHAFVTIHINKWQQQMFAVLQVFL